MLRQLYFAAFMQPMWAAMVNSSDPVLAAIAGKAVKEVAYHIRHAGEWVIRLGDGTDESARAPAGGGRRPRALRRRALRKRWGDGSGRVGRRRSRSGLGSPAFDATVGAMFASAGLDRPKAPFPLSGGRSGRHGEAMGYLLAELQYMQRTYPGAIW